MTVAVFVTVSPGSSDESVFTTTSNVAVTPGTNDAHVALTVPPASTAES